MTRIDSYHPDEMHCDVDFNMNAHPHILQHKLTVLNLNVNLRLPSTDVFEEISLDVTGCLQTIITIITIVLVE